MQEKNIIGQQFGYWTVLSKDDSYRSSKHSKWICRCRCGTIRSVYKTTLLSGRSKSCGCFVPNMKGINKKHGMSTSRIYGIYAGMLARCNAKKGNLYRLYVSRGIDVCNEWKNSFESFFNWAINNGYSDSLTIDRINNDLGYSPDNCRWISIKKQQSNKSNSIYIMYDNEKWCLRTLCKTIGYPYSTAHRHYHYLKDNGIEPTADAIFTRSYNSRH